MLDIIKSCLKISFQGEVSFIICKKGSSYSEIIAQACTRFHIPETQRSGLVLTNGLGYIFEEQLLEYFLLLFPCPELLFYLRLDWQKLRRALNEPSGVKRQRAAEGIPVEKDEELDYVAVPVHRQNCFLGALPSAAASVHRQSCFLRIHQPLQQRQQVQSTATALRRISQLEGVTASEPKRMRLQLPHKPRHSMRSRQLHVAHLATAPRSIRI